MLLLDTNVVSELRKAKSGKAHPLVTAWATKVPAGLYLSATTLLELEMGVLQVERRDSARAWHDGGHPQRGRLRSQRRVVGQPMARVAGVTGRAAS